MKLSNSALGIELGCSSVIRLSLDVHKVFSRFESWYDDGIYQRFEDPNSFLDNTLLFVFSVTM
jgi:hypothetical protein